MRQSLKEGQITLMMKCMQMASREEALKLMRADQLLAMERAGELFPAKPVVHSPIEIKR